LRNPINRQRLRCALAITGQAAAPPRRVINSRRFSNLNLIALPAASATASGQLCQRANYAPDAQLSHFLRVAGGVLNSSEVWVAYLERVVASQLPHSLRVAGGALNSNEVWVDHLEKLLLPWMPPR
jgi:hypothetical protein